MTKSPVCEVRNDGAHSEPSLNTGGAGRDDRRLVVVVIASCGFGHTSGALCRVIRSKDFGFRQRP